MSLLLSLAIVPLVAYAIRKPLGKHPAVFYALALLVCGISFCIITTPGSDPIVRVIGDLFQKGRLAFALFALVMFIGVAKPQSALRNAFMSIRANLSIIASIFIVVHVVIYGTNYSTFIGTLAALRPNVVFSLIASLVLVALLIALASTSFEHVKKKMRASTWKTVQKTAYAFFAVIFVHLSGYLLFAAFQGSAKAQVSYSIYLFVAGLYLILRIRRARLDKLAPANSKEST